MTKADVACFDAFVHEIAERLGTPEALRALERLKHSRDFRTVIAALQLDVEAIAALARKGGRPPGEPVPDDVREAIRDHARENGYKATAAEMDIKENLLYCMVRGDGVSPGALQQAKQFARIIVQKEQRERSESEWARGGFGS
jgi:hypothetical protein